MALKRVLAAAAALLMAVSAAGCGSKESGTDKDRSKTASASAADKSEKSDSKSNDEKSEKSDDSGNESEKEDSSEPGDTGQADGISAEGFVYKEDELGGRIVQGELKDGVFDAGLFTIDIGDGWSLVEEDEGLIMTAHLLYKDGMSSVSVIADKVDEEKQTVPDLDESHALNMEDLEAMGCEKIENEEITVGGERAYLTHASTDLGGGVSFSFVYVECWHGSLHFLMNLGGVGDGVSAAEEDFLALAHSVSFSG